MCLAICLFVSFLVRMASLCCCLRVGGRSRKKTDRSVDEMSASGVGRHSTLACVCQDMTGPTTRGSDHPPRLLFSLFRHGEVVSYFAVMNISRPSSSSVTYPRPHPYRTTLSIYLPRFFASFLLCHTFPLFLSCFTSFFSSTLLYIPLFGPHLEQITRARSLL